MMGTGHSRASQIYKGMRFNYLLISEWNFIGAFQKGHIGPSWRLKVFILTVGKLHCSAASQSQTTARNKFDSLRWSFILTHLVRIINLNLPIYSCDMQNYFPPTNLRCCNRSCQWCQSLPNTVFPPRETFDFFRSDFNYWIYLDSKKKTPFHLRVNWHLWLWPKLQLRWISAHDRWMLPSPQASKYHH